MAEFKKYRVTWVPTAQSRVCWRADEATAQGYIEELLRARGIDWDEMWVVEEPELWGHVFGEEDARELRADHG